MFTLSTVNVSLVLLSIVSNLMVIYRYWSAQRLTPMLIIKMRDRNTHMIINMIIMIIMIVVIMIITIIFMRF